MTYLAAARVIWSVTMIILIWPEIIDYLVIADDKPLAKQLLFEHLGKVGHAIVTSSTFFYTQYTGTFLIFDLFNAGWLYVLGELVLYTPIATRRLSK